jgi:hypothetical protein
MQNIKRVDHVVYVARAENQAAYAEQLSRLCRVKFYGPVDKPESGLRIYISWTAGLEVISPVSETTAWSLHIRQLIEQRGEGIMGVIFGVADIEEARRHAMTLGYAVSDIIENEGFEPWADQTEIMKESGVGMIMNSTFGFGEVKLGPGAL